MTPRLKEQRAFSDAGLARLAQLAGSVPRIADTSARARRVRARLETVSRSPIRRWAWIALLGGGLAFAGTITTRALVSRSPRMAPMAGATPREAPAPQPAPMTLPLTPLSQSTAPVAQSTRPVAPARSHVAEPRPAAPALPLVDSPARDARLLADAVSALRRRDDPARAQGLAEEYLDRHPDGPLAEEALAIALEAATVRGEPTEASGFAARYLVHFPNGRFAVQARTTLR